MKVKTIKTLGLLIAFILGIIFPIGEWQSVSTLIIYIVVSFVAGFWAPFLMQFDLGMGDYIIQMPKWSDKINIKNPLIFAQLLEYILISWGLGLCIGELIQSSTISCLGICLITAGVGIRIGIYFALNKDTIS